MGRFYRISIFSLLVLIWSSCSCCSTDTKNPTNENECSDVLIQGVGGDLNNDGLLDSVNFVNAYPNSTLSIFWGNANNQYNLFKRIESPEFNNELSVDIESQALYFKAQGVEYCFKYQKDNFYLSYYNVHYEGCPSYKLDFSERKMTYTLGFNEGLKPNDTIVYRSIPIPQNKIPESYTIDDCFQQGFHEKYIYYDIDYTDKKIDSFVSEIKREQLLAERKAEIQNIDNDTILNLSYKKGIRRFSIFIDRKEIPNIIKEKLDMDMYSMLSRYIDSVPNSIKDAFEQNIKRWEKLEPELDEQENDEDESFTPVCYDFYSIEQIYKNKNYVTYMYDYTHRELQNERVVENNDFKTYNLNTGEFFSYEMLNKCEGLHQLLIDGLCTCFHAKDYEDLMANLTLGDHSTVDSIPYAQCRPFIYEDTLHFLYRHCEISYWASGTPEVVIPLDKVYPYLTEEGKRFIESIK